MLRLAGGNLVVSKKTIGKTRQIQRQRLKQPEFWMRQKKEYCTFQYEMNNTTNCSENLLNSRNKILPTQTRLFTEVFIKSLLHWSIVTWLTQWSKL